MKTLTALATIALVSFALTTSASASGLKFGPPNTFFTVIGSFGLTKGAHTVSCTGGWEFKTNATGVGKVKSTGFFGSAACQAIQGLGLPWKARAASATTANVLGMAFSTSLGTCGPSTAPFTLDGSGVVTLTNIPLAGGCTVNWSLQAHPVLTIVPN